MLKSLREAFKSVEDEYLKFDRITNKLAEQKDLCALIYISKLFSDNKYIIGGADHDIIFLNVNKQKFEQKF